MDLWAGLCFSGSLESLSEADREFIAVWQKGKQAKEETKPQQLHKASEQEDAEAQFNKGLEYADQDPEEAVKWFRKAAERGHLNAQYLLGDCYAKGKGVSQNVTEAMKWYRKAAEMGHEGALRMVRRFPGV